MLFFRPWSLNWRIPFSYDGDALLGLSAIKSIIDNGWIGFNPYLGAPFGSNSYDFPGADSFFWLILKLFTYISKDPNLIFNLFYLMGFGFIFYATFVCARHQKLNIYFAITIALIFTIQPYHFLRGTQQLFLATYFVIPLATSLILDICGWASENSTNKRLSTNHYLILIVVGSCGIYYAFFSILFLSLVGLSSFGEKKHRQIFFAACQAVAMITLVVLINLIPTFVLHLSLGTNELVAKRSVIESEIYGLRMTQMLLPIWGHQNSFMALINHKYQDHIVITEATSSALGLVGSIGFILLLIRTFFYPHKSLNSWRLGYLAKLNLFAYLYSTVGGLGVIFAFVVMPEFRALNRISIFIAYFSLLGLFIFLQSNLDRVSLSKNKHKAIVCLLSIFLIAIAFYDQVPVGAQGENPVIRNKFIEDQAYFDQIESMLPAGSMIYQAPYVGYPETPPLNKEGYLEMLVPYIHSKTLRWSYGGFKGREGDAWNTEMGSLPADSQILALESSGFRGILINRMACKDACIQLESAARLGSDDQAIIKKDNTMAFYKLKASENPDIKPKFAIQFGKGFYGREVGVDNSIWRWSSQNGELNIYNFSNKPQVITLRVFLTTLTSSQVNFFYQDGIKKPITIIPGKKESVTVSFLTKPGKNKVLIQNTTPSTRVGADPRDYSFKAFDPIMIVN